MNFLKVRGWERWQTYRTDRTPPWIKLHRGLLLNPEWQLLTDAEKGQLVSLWMLAAERNGRIPDDPNLLAKICNLDFNPDLARFLSLQFLEKISNRRQRGSKKHVVLDKEVEVDIREDPPIKPPQSFFLPEWIDPEAWAGFVEMRQRIRAPMTDRAKRLAINALQKHRDAGENPTDLLNASTQNSWKGFWPNTKTNGGTNGKRFETAFDRLHRACADPAPGNGRGETIEGHAEILGADG